MKKCPFCAEDIQDDAVVCKHCKEDLKTSVFSHKNKKEHKEGAFLQTLNCGCIVVLVIILFIVMSALASWLL